MLAEQSLNRSFYYSHSSKRGLYPFGVHIFKQFIFYK